MTKSRGIIKPKAVFTDVQVAMLRNRFPNEKTQQIADDMGFTLQQIRSKAKGLGLAKTPEFMASTDSGRLTKLTAGGVAFRYPKGHVPANKGKKTPGYAPGRMAETQFVKGRMPPNYLPLGSERYSKEGYLQRKMTETGYPPKDWVPVHWLLWIEHHGPIPAGHRVCFKDRDKKNVVIGNLELLTISELMKRNSRHNYSPELNEVIQLRALLTRSINKRDKNERTENNQ